MNSLFCSIKYACLVFVVSSSLLLTSCVDLNDPPKSLIIGEKQYEDPSSYVGALAKLYSSLTTTGQKGPAGDADIKAKDEGFSSYMRMIWYAEEFPTEEAVTAWNDEGIQELYPQTWTAENNFISLIYIRLFTHIAQTNEFIANSTDALLDSRGVAADLKVKVQRYRKEARFLRALSYYYVLNLFRNVPLVTVNEIAQHNQADPKEVFDFIESELKEIESDLPEDNPYPRVTKGAVRFLLSRLYLNAEVFFGQKKYAEAADYAEKVINSQGPLGAYELEPTYNHIFGADNNTSKEIIFAVEHDPQKIRTYGGTTFIISGSIGGEEMNPDDYGVSAGWAGTRVTADFVDYFDFNKNGNTNDPEETDVRGKNFFTQGQNKEVNLDNIASFENGYALTKFTNLNRDGSKGSTSAEQTETPDTDLPVFRLGEAFLNYAEAVVRGNGDRAKALGYVNQLRSRANAATITDAELTLDFLKTERSRELHWEMVRRTDLIRFGAFAKNSNEQFRNLYPIPFSERAANPNLSQNPGY